jgi:hypothetical protein
MDKLKSGILLQIETVGPEGHKLIWVFLILVAIAFAAWVVLRKKGHSWLSFNTLKVEIQKNKIYHPETVTLSVKNKRTKAVVIDSVNLTFRGFNKKRSFKITQVAGKKIYPLFLEAGNNHTIVIALASFYSKFPKLKKMARLRIEVNTKQGKTHKTRYLLLKPTLFRSNR